LRSNVTRLEEEHMKKATTRLRIRLETIRVLGSLDLVHAAAGGPDVRVMDTGDINRTCVAQALPIAGAGVKP
jgi:hypothetical protein